MLFSIKRLESPPTCASATNVIFVDGRTRICQITPKTLRQTTISHGKTKTNLTKRTPWRRQQLENNNNNSNFFYFDYYYHYQLYYNDNHNFRTTIIYKSPYHYSIFICYTFFISSLFPFSYSDSFVYLYIICTPLPSHVALCLYYYYFILINIILQK